MLKFLQKINCQIPLSCLNKCKYQICQQNAPQKSYQINANSNYLPQTNKYWSEFLKSQQKSAANYLYKYQIYGNNKDCTLVKNEPFPVNLIHQRLCHMPVIGSLDRRDMFYLLSFILNINTISSQLQQEYMEICRSKDLLDVTILNYMKLMARQPATQLNLNEKQNFIKNCSELLSKLENPCNLVYFNPEHIFKKSMIEMDPYELAYLKDLTTSRGALNHEQYFYLARIVERLQIMSALQRDEYLKVLYEKNILNSPQFGDLLKFFYSKNHKINHKKLRLLLAELEQLMGISLCIPRPAEDDEQDDEVSMEKSMRKKDIDGDKLKKILASLMKGGSLDFSKLNDLKYFLKDLMDLSPEELEKTLKNLMASGTLSAEHLKFIQNMIANGDLGGDPNKRKLLMQMLNKVSPLPEVSKAQKIAAAKAAAAKVKAEAVAKAKFEAEEKLKAEVEANAKAKAEADVNIAAAIAAAKVEVGKLRKGKETKNKEEKLKKERKLKDKDSKTPKDHDKEKIKKFKDENKENEKPDERDIDKYANDQHRQGQGDYSTMLCETPPPPKCKEVTVHNKKCELNPEFTVWLDKCQTLPPPPIIRCKEVDSLISLCPIKTRKCKSSAYEQPNCCICTCYGNIIFP